MSYWINIESSLANIAREKLKAQKLKKTNWWKNKVAQGVCYYCGNRMKSKEITMDHIVPISRGGRSTKGNVVSCCKNCNNEKKYLTPAEIILYKINKNLNDQDELN